MKFLTIGLTLLLIRACLPTPQPLPPEETELCDKAGENIQALKCLDRKGNPMWENLRGVAFAETCKIVQEQGGVFVDPSCIASAKNCAEVMTCPIKK